MMKILSGYDFRSDFTLCQAVFVITFTFNLLLLYHNHYVIITTFTQNVSMCMRNKPCLYGTEQLLREMYVSGSRHNIYSVRIRLHFSTKIISYHQGLMMANSSMMKPTYLMNP